MLILDVRVPGTPEVALCTVEVLGGPKCPYRQPAVSGPEEATSRKQML